MIISYSLFAGIEANIQMQAALDSKDPAEWTEFVMHVFNGWFAIEVILRLAAYGFGFFLGKDWRWNVFDLTLVIISMSLILLDGLSVSFFRLLRVFKVLRALQIVRLFRTFKELRLLVATILTSLPALWWSLAFVSLITYLCSILFVHASISHLQDLGAGHNGSDDSLKPSLEEYFGTLPRSMYILTACITGGVDWTKVGVPLWKVSYFYGFCFTLYVLGSVLGILNIVTGMFVERASNIAKIDRDVAITDEIHKMEADVRDTMRLFQEFDTAGHGKVPVDEFMEFLAQERVIAYFATLDINVTHRGRLQAMFDVDDDACVSLEEFVIGCTRLRGPAAKSELANVLLLMRQFHDELHESMNVLHQTFGTLSRQNSPPTTLQ